MIKTAISYKEFRQRKLRKIVLAADIGGTNTRLGAYAVAKKPLLLFKQKTPTQSQHQLTKFINNFNELIREVYQTTPTTAGIACAGIPNKNRVYITNAGFELDLTQLSRACKLKRCVLLNDFEALGHALPLLTSKERLTIQPGTTKKKEGPIGIIGAGTGLGHAMLFPEKKGYIVKGSEGGHSAIGIRTITQARVAAFLIATHRTPQGVPDREDVLSGRGILNLYAFARKRERKGSYLNQRRIHRSEKPASLIFDLAEQKKDKACNRAVELFLEFYGMEAANLALQIKATGGIFITGGIAQKHAHLFKGTVFHKGYLTGRKKDADITLFLRSVPVSVVTHPEPGLFGAAVAATRS